MSSLDAAIAKINKRYKDTISIIKGSDVIQFDYLKTGIPSLDYYIGGLPKGRFTLLYGRESVGKTLTAITIMANLTQEGKQVLYVDTEHTADPRWMEINGVNLEHVRFVKPTHLEEFLNVIRNKDILEAASLIVIDSVNGIGSISEQFNKGKIDGVERELEKNDVAVLPRKLSKYFRVATAATAKANCPVLLIGQIRTAGIGSLFTYEEASGGNALKHHVSLRIAISARKVDNIDGHEAHMRVTKSKIGTHESLEWGINFIRGEGFDMDDDALMVAIDSGRVERKGAWYYYGEESAQGKEKFLDMLREKNLFEEAVYGKSEEPDEENQDDVESSDNI